MVEFMLCNEISKEQAQQLNQDYFFEFKFDGLRAGIYVENHKISKIIGRYKNNVLKQFIEFQGLTFEFEKGLIDSEIIVVNNGKGYGDFNEGLAFRTHLQNEKEIQERAEKLKAKIMAFDILELNGENLRLKPLWKRKEILRQNIKDNELIEVARQYELFSEVWAIVEQQQLEGLIAKHKNTAYEGIRSSYWNKIKNWKEIVIEFDSYENAKSENNPFYKGIVLTNSEGLRCSCLGKKSEEVKRILQEQGKVKASCQYLEHTREGKARFITFKELVKGG
jgi:ATP-dependent DNA ligase